MEELGILYNTDKITHHHYHRFYPQYLEAIRDKEEGAFLEIGVDRGGSMKMWQEFFPYLFIYGVDIDIEDSGLRFKIFRADQSKKDDIESLVAKIKEKEHKVWAVNDDGSHVPEHQILTFNILFDKILEPGGTYIIEDIETSYWGNGNLYGYNLKCGYQNSSSLIEKVKDLIDFLNREFLTSENFEICKARLEHSGFHLETLTQVSTVTFGHNCLIFKKKTPTEYGLEGRPYRFKQFL